MGCGKSTRGGVVGLFVYVELGDDGQEVGEGECGVKEEVRDGRGGEGEGNQIWCTVDTSWDTSWWTPAGTQTPAALRVRSTIQLTCNCDQRHTQYG